MEDFIYFLIFRVDNGKAKFIRRIIFQKKNVALISYAILEKYLPEKILDLILVNGPNVISKLEAR